MTRGKRMLATTLAALLLGACGMEGDEALVAEDGSALLAKNGLSANGLSRNGLSRNGLSRNGLSRNGLSRNGLLSADFTTWFNADPVSSAEVMAYVVKCAMSRTQSLTYTSTTKKRYTWVGNLGLAPVWSSGQVATPAEEQLISACLAAHVNKFGLNIDLSVRGFLENGTAVALDPGEATMYTSAEACFFGNLFAEEGIYVGYASGAQNANLSTPRGCAIESGEPGVCDPLQNMGTCLPDCTRPNGLAATGTPFSSCLYNGKAYRPISTWLKASDVYLCGDAICQAPFESSATCSRDCL